MFKNITDCGEIARNLKSSKWQRHFEDLKLFSF